MSIPPDNALLDIGLHESITAIDTDESLSTGNQKHYPIDKLEAHIRNVPHLAVSIFIFCGEKLLLQKRSDTKYHSAGLWANSVCSHPRWQESTLDCAHRRLKEELGLGTDLRSFGEIDYMANVGELFENERVACFVGKVLPGTEIEQFNPIEVADVRWLSMPDISREIAEQPTTFTEWFKIYMNKHRGMIDALVDNSYQSTA